MRKLYGTTILIVAIIGMLFSGFLAYGEIFRKSCALGTCSTQVGGVPSCVYGFGMFLLITVLAILNLRQTPESFDEEQEETEEDEEEEDEEEEEEAETTATDLGYNKEGK